MLRHYIYSCYESYRVKRLEPYKKKLFLKKLKSLIIVHNKTRPCRSHDTWSIRETTYDLLLIEASIGMAAEVLILLLRLYCLRKFICVLIIIELTKCTRRFKTTNMNKIRGTLVTRNHVYTLLQLNEFCWKNSRSIHSTDSNHHSNQYFSFCQTYRQKTQKWNYYIG